MRQTKISLLLFIILTLSPALVFAGASDYWEGKGRIALSSDGDMHDNDDMQASMMTLMILAKAKLQHNVTLYTYADHIWGNERNDLALMKISTEVCGKRFGFDKTRFMAAVENPEAAYNAMCNEIIKSTKNDPLFIIAAGPMQVVGEALNRAKAKKPKALKYVTVISHSTWNDRHADNPMMKDNHHSRAEEVHSGWTWKEMEEEFGNRVNLNHISDQNGTGEGAQKYRSNDKFKAGTWNKWSWMNEHEDPNINWIFQQAKSNPVGPDFSDAGMAYYLCADLNGERGDEFGNPEKLRQWMGAEQISNFNEYTADWTSLATHNQSPEWFADAKLGIYFHWGVYSVPAFHNEWYPYFMYRSDGNNVAKHHKEKYGDPSEFNYHDFVPMFTGEHFDAEDWAQLFKDAGAKFAGPSAEHCDGFALWDSEVNPWNAADRGPKQDITGKLAKSLRARDMKVITTFHHARNMQRHSADSSDWGGYNSHFTYHPDFATSSIDPDTAKLYGNLPTDEYPQYWLDQLLEVINQYSPDIIWFDSWLNMIPEKYRKEFAAYYLNHAQKTKQEVVIGYKQNDLPLSLGVLDIEQGGKKDMSESVWLTDVTLGNESWCYTDGLTYKSASMVVRNMIDVWSKNGVVLLNISPKANGVIPQKQRDLLKEIGAWIKKHEEAIYETRPFDYYGFGNAAAADGHFGGQSATVEYTAEDGRFMKSKDGKYLYLFMLGKPEPGTEISIRGLAKHDFYPTKGFGKITVLGSNTEAKWHFELRNFVLTVPDCEMDELATVFKIELK